MTEVIKQIIKKDMSDYEKELAIHDYIVLNTVYDYDNYMNDTIPEESYTPYGVLMKGIGVCSGYARTFKLFMDSLGIECKYVTGYAFGPKGKEGHAWNIVKIDGKYYHVDTTWDDPSQNQVDSIQYDAPSYITGCISLPQNEVAPKEGITLRMVLYIINLTSNRKTSYSRGFMISIPKGKSSVDYSIAVPDIDYGYSLRCEVFNTNQYKSGYYYEKELNPDYKKYTLVTPANNTGLDFTLERDSKMPNEVQFTLLLPKGEVAPAGGMKATVTAGSSNHTNNTDVVIP